MAASTQGPVTRSLLLTDLVDSTKIVAEIGDDRAAELMARHDRIARDLLAAHRGREIDKSDGFLFLFEEPLDGLSYALAYHAALMQLSAELGLKLAARAGIHTGEVRLVWNSAEDVARGAKPCEVEGIAKATAARIMTLASGGQLLISPACRAGLPPGFGAGQDLRLISHGWFQMKGLAEPMELWEAGQPGVAPLQPPGDSAKVFRVVHSEEGWRPAREIPHNLPLSPGSFVGRAPELRAIADAVADGATVLTLAGPGGAGKTQLARHYGTTWLGDYPGGAWLCDLSEARDLLGICAALGRALGVPLDQGDPLRILGDSLAGRGRALLLMDTVEPVIAVIGEALASWRARAPAVVWLNTSRQRLALPGERLIYVDPLPLPPQGLSLAELGGWPVVQLFVDRARAVQPSFELREDNAGDVAELVAMLDGLPLAIELAAARVRVLPPRRIIERMGRRFELLAGQRGKQSQRQATLRGAIDWSWGLLSPHERAALAQCALFEGSFDLEAVEAVIDLSAWPAAPMAVDVLESLVDQSLVRSQGASEDLRFSLFRSIADYAREKLEDPGAIEAEGEGWSGTEQAGGTAGRHAEHFARWGQGQALEGLWGPRGPERFRQLQSELPNILAAARHALGDGQASLAAQAGLGALAVYERVGPVSAGEALAEELLEAGPEPAQSLRLRAALGQLQTRAGRADLARAGLEEVAGAAARRKDLRLEAQARATLAQGALLRGELEAARQGYELARDLHRRARDRRGEALDLTELGHVVGIRGGQLTEGEAWVQRALTMLNDLGDAAGEALARSYLGALRCIQGDLEQGRQAYEVAGELARRVGDRRTEGLCEGMIAGILVLVERMAEARPHFEAAVRIARLTGDRVQEGLHALNYAEMLARVGDVEGAAGWLQRAIDGARDMGDPLQEGVALGALGALRAGAGDPSRGRQLLLQGEARLREAGDGVELGKLLCKLGRVEQGLGQPEAAGRAEEAAAIAAALGVQAESELGKAVAELRGLLDSRPESP